MVSEGRVGLEGDNPRFGNRRSVNILLAATFLYALNFALLLTVAPVLVEATAPKFGGLVNTILLAGTVAAQWTSPLLLRYHSKYRLYIAGVVLMGAPSAAYAYLATSTVALFAASAVRGVGFGILTVVSASLVMDLSPPAIHGRIMGRYGLATAIPAIVGPPLGLELLRNGLQAAPGVIGLLVCLVAAVLVLTVQPSRADRRRPRDTEAMPLLAVLRQLGDRTLLRYSAAFFLVSVAWGGTVSYLPFALPAVGLASAASFLLISGIARAVGRWWAGVLADRGLAPAVAAGPTVLIMAVGLTLLALPSNPWTAVPAALLYGAGLGVFQTMVFLALMHGSSYGYSAGAALFSTSLDLGGMFGTAALAGVAVVAGYQAVLWAMAVAMILAWPLVRFRAGRTSHGTPG